MRAALALAVGAWPVLAAALEPQPPVLVSVRWDTGEPISGLCASTPRFGPNSRYLSFDCFGDDLTPGDDNDRRDTVLLDRATGATELISVSSAGQQTGYDSLAGYSSTDGQRIAFMSMGPLHPDYWPPPSPNLTIGRPAFYLRDRGTGVTELISRDAFGQALTGSPGFYGAHLERNEILFHYSGDIRSGPSQTFGFPTQLWVRNWVTGAVELISATPTGELGNGALGSFSASGRFVVFVAGDALGLPARPGDANIYLRDRVTGSIERLTWPWPWTGDEFQGALLNVRQPRVSANGRFVVFSSTNTELHPDTATAGGTRVYLLDRSTGQLDHLSTTPGYSSFNINADISDDGRYVAWSSRNFSFQGPADPPADMRAIWVLDRNTGQRANVTAPLGPLLADNDIQLDLAPDGTAIAFTWRVADPAHPLFNRMMLYTVQLRGTEPPAPPEPVPALSPWWLLLLAAGVVLTGTTVQRATGAPSRQAADQDRARARLRSG